MRLLEKYGTYVREWLLFELSIRVIISNRTLIKLKVKEYTYFQRRQPYHFQFASHLNVSQLLTGRICLPEANSVHVLTFLNGKVFSIWNLCLKERICF